MNVLSWLFHCSVSRETEETTLEVRQNQPHNAESEAVTHPQNTGFRHVALSIAPNAAAFADQSCEGVPNAPLRQCRGRPDPFEGRGALPRTPHGTAEAMSVRLARQIDSNKIDFQRSRKEIKIR